MELVFCLQRYVFFGKMSNFAAINDVEHGQALEQQL